MVGCGSRTGLELADGAELPIGGSGAGGSDPTPCPAHFADCDNTGTCETDLAASANNCGACGNVCPDGLVCGAGVCRPPEDIIQVAAGLYHTCALRASGEVLCWGLNLSGVLGDGTLDPHITPLPVSLLNDAVEIDANTGQDTHQQAMCARRATGAIVCWGSGVAGQLGNGSEDDHPLPVEVVGVTEGASVKTTLFSVCALLRHGAVSCWGDNTLGQLGDGTSEDRLTAAPVVGLDGALQLDVGELSCATLPTAEVACWGYDRFGWAGSEGQILVEPTSVGGVTDATSVWLPGPASIQLPGAQCVIHAGGAVSCTGENAYGTVDIDIPYDLKNGEMKTIEGVSDAVQLAGTFSTTCAVRANGQVLCWGNNDNGLLGIGTVEQPAEKVVTVPGLEGVLHLDGGRNHMCAALGSGGVACWGSNGAGELGDGTTEDRAAPVHVLGLP